MAGRSLRTSRIEVRPVGLLPASDLRPRMDEIEALEYRGWRFLCSGEQLPSGEFQAVVRHRTHPTDELRTLVLNPERHSNASAALLRAKELAIKWAQDHE